MANFDIGVVSGLNSGVFFCMCMGPLSYKNQKHPVPNNEHLHYQSNDNQNDLVECIERRPILLL